MSSLPASSAAGVDEIYEQFGGVDLFERVVIGVDVNIRPVAKVE